MKSRKPNYYNQQNQNQNQNQNQPQRKPLKPQQNKDISTTSWSEVSNWYNDYLKDEDNYQHKVILPNLLRLLNLKEVDKKINILDLGCGQGFFIEKILDTYKENINFFGVDVSSRLLKIAEDKFSQNKNVQLDKTDAVDLSHIKDKSIDKIYCVLALQNMSDVDAVIKEVNRVLKDKGQCLFVINHPSFRIPKESDWRYDTFIHKQGRITYTYMSDKKYIIDMNPGKTAQGERSEETISFHHPLQYFSKIFNKQGLAISRIEEWISHKKSEEGARQKAEDDSRKEIPLFMCLELIKVAK